MRRILVAGVGNVFFGDDGFGVAVARHLSSTRLPAGVRVADFGIRGVHLAYELLEPLDLLIVIDVAARGGPPGTLYVIEPDLDDTSPVAPEVTMSGAHGMDVCAVFATVRTLGGVVPRVRIVGCEPAHLEPSMNLGEEATNALPAAVRLVQDLVQRELAGTATPIATEAPR